MNKFTPYTDRGWLPHLLPIIPPDGEISPDSNLNQKDAGKQPGFYNIPMRYWLGMKGWSINTTTQADIDAWCQWPGDAVGIRTRLFPAFDIDIDNIELATMVNNMVHAFTGGTAFRWRDNSPRRMWFLQLAEGETPQGKCRIILKDDLGAVELLGAGQQAVLSGPHTSGGMQFFEGTPVIVTIKQLNALWDAIINLLAPYTLKVTKAGDINLGDRRGGEIVHVAEDAATIEIARQVIANTEGVGEGERDDQCYKMVTSIRQNQGITADKCFELMQEWGQRCNPPFPPNEIKTRVKSGYGGGAQGAQGELNPQYMMKSANFGTHPVPATCSNHPIISDKKSAIKSQDKSIEDMTWINNFLMTDEEMNKISDPEWMYENLIIKGHLSAVVAPPNGGKTTILMNVAGQMPDSIKVYYVNADVSGVDAKRYYYQAKKNDFTLLLPDMKPGLSMLDVVKNLEQMNQIDKDYSDTLFIFDTLKKMTDVIDKRQSKSLYRTLRGLSAKGMTIVLLGHTNKYKDSDGNYIYEGTGDLRSDLDELIYLIPQKHDDGSLTVSTHPDKVRGEFKPITFEISKDRQVSQRDYVDTAKENKWLNQYEKDEHIINAIYTAMQHSNSVQIDIIKYCHEKYSIGNKSTKRVLDYFSEGNYKLWIAERGAEFNKITYRRNLDNE